MKSKRIALYDDLESQRVSYEHEGKALSEKWCLYFFILGEIIIN